MRFDERVVQAAAVESLTGAGLKVRDPFQELEVKIMRKRACVSLLALSLVVSILAVASASAKSADGLRAQIPFDFNVGDKMIPAGVYAIDAMNADESVLHIRATRGDESAVALTRSTRAKTNAESSPRLVFHKYGDQYFLSAVWGAGETGRALSESKRERNLRKELEVAGNARMEVVVVAAVR